MRGKTRFCRNLVKFIFAWISLNISRFGHRVTIAHGISFWILRVFDDCARWFSQVKPLIDSQRSPLSFAQTKANRRFLTVNITHVIKKKKSFFVKIHRQFSQNVKRLFSPRRWPSVRRNPCGDERPNNLLFAAASLNGRARDPVSWPRRKTNDILRSHYSIWRTVI